MLLLRCDGHSRVETFTKMYDALLFVQYHYTFTNSVCFMKKGINTKAKPMFIENQIQRRYEEYETVHQKRQLFKNLCQVYARYV